MSHPSPPPPPPAWSPHYSWFPSVLSSSHFVLLFCSVTVDDPPLTTPTHNDNPWRFIRSPIGTVHHGSLCGIPPERLTVRQAEEGNAPDATALLGSSLVASAVPRRSSLFPSPLSLSLSYHCACYCGSSLALTLRGAGTIGQPRVRVEWKDARRDREAPLHPREPTVRSWVVGRGGDAVGTDEPAASVLSALASALAVQASIPRDEARRAVSSALTRGTIFLVSVSLPHPTSAHLEDSSAGPSRSLSVADSTLALSQPMSLSLSPSRSSSHPGRQFVVRLDNQTKLPLARLSVSLSPGAWTVAPPESVDPQTVSLWGGRADTTLGGIALEIVYAAAATRSDDESRALSLSLSLSLNIPRVGSPSHSLTLHGADKDSFRLTLASTGPDPLLLSLSLSRTPAKLAPLFGAPTERLVTSFGDAVPACWRELERRVVDKQQGARDAAVVSLAIRRLQSMCSVPAVAAAAIRRKLEEEVADPSLVAGGDAASRASNVLPLDTLLVAWRDWLVHLPSSPVPPWAQQSYLSLVHSIDVHDDDTTSKADKVSSRPPSRGRRVRDSAGRSARPAHPVLAFLADLPESRRSLLTHIFTVLHALCDSLAQPERLSLALSATKWILKEERDVRRTQPTSSSASGSTSGTPPSSSLADSPNPFVEMESKILHVQGIGAVERTRDASGGGEGIRSVTSGSFDIGRLAKAVRVTQWVLREWGGLHGDEPTDRG